MSSRDGRLRKVFPVAPGGDLVVEGAGLQASVQDADKPVRQPPEGVIVFKSLGTLLVVERPGAGGGVQRRERPGREGGKVKLDPPFLSFPRIRRVAAGRVAFAAMSCGPDRR